MPSRWSRSGAFQFGRGNWATERRSSPQRSWGDWKGLYDVTAGKKGESDPPKKTRIDPRLVRDVASWLIRGATAIIVEWISKGGRLW